MDFSNSVFFIRCRKDGFLFRFSFVIHENEQTQEVSAYILCWELNLILNTLTVHARTKSCL